MRISLYEAKERQLALYNTKAWSIRRATASLLLLLLESGRPTTWWKGAGTRSCFQRALPVGCGCGTIA